MPNKNDLTGAGPFLIPDDSGLPALDPQEPWDFDFARGTYRGKKGKLKKHVPFDEVQVTNYDPDNPLTVVYNGKFDARVSPSSETTFDRQGVRSVRVVNVGSSTIDAGDVLVEAKKEPYGSDEQAREEAQKPYLARAVEGITGLPLGGGK